MVSIVYDDARYGLSILDLSTNKWLTSEFDSFEKLSLQIYKISPKEVILEKKLFGDDSIKDLLSKKYSLNVYYFE
jgi:DNA mismatch repair ATPase MutS